MTLTTRIESLVIRVAQEFNEIRAHTGNLAALTTHDKSSLVAAINELKSVVAESTAIDDTQATTATAYSSSKVLALLEALKSEILGGADAAYDTLVEIQQLLQNDSNGLDALLAALNQCVRFDRPQPLNLMEQDMACANIGALSEMRVGDIDTDFVAIFNGSLIA